MQEALQPTRSASATKLRQWAPNRYARPAAPGGRSSVPVPASQPTSRVQRMDFDRYASSLASTSYRHRTAALRHSGEPRATPPLASPPGRATWVAFVQPSLNLPSARGPCPWPSTMKISTTRRFSLPCLDRQHDSHINSSSSSWPGPPPRCPAPLSSATHGQRIRAWPTWAAWPINRRWVPFPQRFGIESRRDALQQTKEEKGIKWHSQASKSCTTSGSHSFNRWHCLFRIPETACSSFVCTGTTTTTTLVAGSSFQSFVRDNGPSSSPPFKITRGPPRHPRAHRHN